MNLTADSCTALQSVPPEHEYLENTVSSILRAFELGADTVEIDVHPTAPSDPDGERLVVFHDWTLDCRTEARCENGCQCSQEKTCVTDQQTWSYMKNLDVGYGYTADGGKTFPFRGKGRGLMPTFIEVVSLLRDQTSKSLLVNVKDPHTRTQELLLKELGTFDESVRSRVLVEFPPAFRQRFHELGTPEAIWQGSGTRRCLSKYIVLGWSGYVPEGCRDTRFFIPLHQDLGILHSWLSGISVTDLIWGWPDRFQKRLQGHGSQVGVSEVDSPEDLIWAQQQGFEFIMTNKIELIGPIVTKKP
ncbi:MAG TPA: glycerophosphodiester phosphodiesterase family protein [Oligoflexus sp.]|uniref:glycerophosphodiester phosphodiesterase family protein n=1 Tax=Oligoflexus sp. TaxID=1971216 RepID=UPI002D6C81D9|nr:glycerophosphodiester phosphodiesterase family protein [Oligoflexus sp.]HYX32920.1 glycerophosphodiester phosphodiesterase family protein [Oligoflexus sp.]